MWKLKVGSPFFIKIKIRIKLHKQRTWISNLNGRNALTAGALLTATRVIKFHKYHKFLASLQYKFVHYFDKIQLTTDSTRTQRVPKICSP